MAYNDTQLDVIDARVRAAVAKTKTTGTMVERDPDSNYGTVLFDGSSVAVPVKVLNNTWARANDRVVLDRYGSDWVVTGTFGTGEPNESSWRWVASVTRSTTSGTPVVIPDTVRVPFVKERGVGITALYARITGTGWTQTNPAGIIAGIRINDGFDHDLAQLMLNTPSQHQLWSGEGHLAVLPGELSVDMLWRRYTGTGTLIFGTDDTIQLFLAEVPFPDFG